MSRPLPGEFTGYPGRELESMGEMWNSMTTIAERENYDVLLHDNRSQSYRNQEDGTLFVGRQPHEVRPPSEIGVRYQITNSSHRPEYEIQALRLHTYHNLCQACVDCLNYYCQYIGARSKVCKSQEVQIAND